MSRTAFITVKIGPALVLALLLFTGCSSARTGNAEPEGSCPEAVELEGRYYRQVAIPGDRTSITPTATTALAQDSLCGDLTGESIRLSHIRGVEPTDALYDPNAEPPTLYIAKGHDVQDILRRASSQ
ncbi:hypothetical protein [Nocardioides aequoreus]|uniref:hypothetical protein n=1 Tax=Nocardioides aequoreus TaxID=397278 RepID=UPI0004C44F7F|nr:hypothetical protein [Nocardioides aequoreus]